MIVSIWNCVIYMFLNIVLIVFIRSRVPRLWCWWWIQNMYIANSYIRDLFMFGEFVGLSYVMVSAAKCARTCVSRNGPVSSE